MMWRDSGYLWFFAEGADMTFYKKLEAIWRKNDSFVCVGLDPDLNKLPDIVKKQEHPIFEFNKRIIDKTHDLVCAYKPQAAYYAASAAEKELEQTIKYIKKTYPDIPVILDAKRGDIGSTAEMYAREVFDRYDADAVTVNPYLGSDTLEPFLKRDDRGVIILCKTSNPGSSELQSLSINNKMIYEIIAEKAQKSWNTNNNVLLVVGATFPEEMKKVRSLAPDIPFLVPGVGAQGGSPEEAIKNGLRKDGLGLIISSSRGIIYAGKGDNFDSAARDETIKLREMINKSK
jgi:orotidine-5'-phosphate decarboxylase